MKSRWASKTYWVNLASILVATLSGLIPSLQMSLSPAAFVWWTVGLAVANIALRELPAEELKPLRKPPEE